MRLGFVRTEKRYLFSPQFSDLREQLGPADIEDCQFFFSFCEQLVNLIQVFQIYLEDQATEAITNDRLNSGVRSNAFQSVLEPNYSSHLFAVNPDGDRVRDMLLLVGL